MPRCAFHDIPNEILLQIVQDASVKLPEQLCLSLTSHRLRSVAELRLYRSVALRDIDWDSQTEPKLQKFLRTVVSRPELGAITRRLDILWYRPFSNDEHGDKGVSYHVDEEQLIIMQKLAREKGMSARAVSELEKGWCRPHFSLLMHFLPKLESLKLEDGDTEAEMNTMWAWGQGEYHGPTPVGLQFLSSLELFETRDIFWPAGDVLPLMSLPALNSFQVNRFGGEGDIRWDEGDAKASEDSEDEQEDIFRSFRFVKRSSKLKKLRFHQTVVQPSLLEDILQIPEALDVFLYECDASGIHHYEVDTRRMANALRYHVNSLTFLSLSLVNYTGPLADVSSMGSLRDFPLLKKLAISCMFLLGHPSREAPRGCTAFFDLLPSNLTNLAIEVGLICEVIDLNNESWEGWELRAFLDAIQDDGDHVNQWRRVRGQRVPHLKTFSVLIWEDPIDTRKELDALGITIDPISWW